MTLREAVMRKLRADGKTEDQIEEHMKAVDEFMGRLAAMSPLTLVVDTMSTVQTADILDHDTEARDA